MAKYIQDFSYQPFAINLTDCPGSILITRDGYILLTEGGSEDGDDEDRMNSAFMSPTNNPRFFVRPASPGRFEMVIHYAKTDFPVGTHHDETDMADWANAANAFLATKGTPTPPMNHTNGTLHPSRVITVGHSPDPDDAFMFYALAHDKIETDGLKFTHELQDIETLNRRAMRGELEVSAVSIHAYSYLLDKYALLPSGCSMGDQYGPMVVAREPMTIDRLKSATIAVPGTMTTAFLTLRLLLGDGFVYEVMPFDEILQAVADGKYDAGLIIHEGQLTFQNQGLQLIVDLGVWWQEKTGLPLPLGGNVVRRDLGPNLIRQISRLLKESIRYSLDHRQQALDYALNYARDMDRDLADKFVGMYVNEWTIDYGERGRAAVKRLLDEAHAAGVIPNPVNVEFVE